MHFNGLGTTQKDGRQMLQHGHLWAIVSPALPACLPIRAAIWQPFPCSWAAWGPCKSVNSRAALGARKAEVTRPFRSGNHKASIEDSRLVSTSRQGWLLSGPILVGGEGLYDFSPHSPGACSDETRSKPIYRYS